MTSHPADFVNRLDAYVSKFPLTNEKDRGLAREAGEKLAKFSMSESGASAITAAGGVTVIDKVQKCKAQDDRHLRVALSKAIDRMRCFTLVDANSNDCPSQNKIPDGDVHNTAEGPDDAAEGPDDAAEGPDDAAEGPDDAATPKSTPPSMPVHSREKVLSMFHSALDAKLDQYGKYLPLMILYKIMTFAGRGGLIKELEKYSPQRQEEFLHHLLLHRPQHPDAVELYMDVTVKRIESLGEVARLDYKSHVYVSQAKKMKTECAEVFNTKDFFIAMHERSFLASVHNETPGRLTAPKV